MKRNLLHSAFILTLVLFAGVLYAQIPNNSFEAWEPDPLYGNLNPVGWETTNDDTEVSVAQYTPAKVGSFAMKVETFDPGFLTLPGIAFAEFPYDGRPAYFSCWVKTSVEPGDAVYIIVSMWKGDTLVASPDSCTFVLDSTISNYTYLSMHLSYLSALTPDSANIMVIAGKYETASLGTEIIVDEMVFGNTAGTGDIRPSGQFQTGPSYPNPSSDKVFLPVSLQKSAGIEAQIYSNSGSLIRTVGFGMLSAGSHNLELTISDLADGTYHYKLSSAGLSQSGHFTVLH
jgi:hypothetical protein